MLNYVLTTTLWILLLSMPVKEQAMIKAFSKTKAQVMPTLKNIGATLVKHKYKAGAGVVGLCAAVAVHDYYKPSKVLQRRKVKLQKQLDTLINDRDEMFAQLNKDVKKTLSDYGELPELAVYSNGVRFAKELQSFGLRNRLIVHDVAIDDLSCIKNIMRCLDRHELTGDLIKSLEEYLTQVHCRINQLKETLAVLCKRSVDNIENLMKSSADATFLSRYKNPLLIAKNRAVEHALLEAGKKVLKASLQKMNHSNDAKVWHEKSINEINTILALRDCLIW